MKKFIYHLNSPIGTKFKQKRVEACCETYAEADQKIKTDYPGWQVSMFWPEWKPEKKIEIQYPPRGFTSLF